MKRPQTIFKDTQNIHTIINNARRLHHHIHTTKHLDLHNPQNETSLETSLISFRTGYFYVIFN